MTAAQKWSIHDLVIKIDGIPVRIPGNTTANRNNPKTFGKKMWNLLEFQGNSITLASMSV